jgi:hypothetical protein
MSNSNGINTLARSINGIITYADGSGTLIQNGKIITITLTANIINALNIIISSIGSNGLLTIGSATTTEIKIIPNGNLTLGSATSTDTLIQNSDGVVMGQTPSSYNPVTGLMNAPGMRFENKSGTSILDFHSNTVGSGQTDSRIISTGGTATALHGTLAMTSGTLNLSAMDTTNISNLITNITSTTKISLISAQIDLNAAIVKVNNILPLTLNGIIKLGDETQGSSQTDYGVYLQGKRNALSYYKAATGQTYPTFVESVSNGIVAGFDFHTSGANTVDYDARIECGSATTGATTGTAIMSIVASAVKMDKILSYTLNGPILIGDETLFPYTDYYGVRLQGGKSALAYYKVYYKDNPTFIETTTTGITAIIDFHSDGSNAVDFDARIKCDNATTGATTSQTGTLSLQANIINLNALSTINLSPTTSTTINKQVSLGWLQTNITPCFTNINGVNGQCNIDFHSSGTNNVGYDSRIYAYNGNATSGNGAMAFVGTQFAFLGDVLTSVIKARTPGGTLTIGDNLRGGSMTIGSALTTGTLNIKSGGTTTITSPTFNVVTSTGITITAPQMTMVGTQNLGYSGGATPAYLEITTGGGNAYIDFHSSGGYNVDFDTRILSYGGGSTSQTGSLNYYAGTHNFLASGGSSFSGTGGVRFNNGFSFNQGYFTSNHIMTGGGQAINRNLGAGSATTEFISFGMTFAPGVIITLAGYAADAASMGVVTNFNGTTTTGFTATFYNSRTVTAPANTYGLNWIASGPI